MTRRRNKKKNGMRPGFAVLLFLGSVAFVVPQLRDSLADPGAIASFMGLDEGEDPELDDLTETQEVAWLDLIAEFGSLQGKPNVRMAFAAAPDVDLTPSAPGGEMAPEGEGWIGDDPPLLRLGVIMVSEKSRRAVLGGSVVGIGDMVGGGEVVAIEQGRLHLRWQQRVLTYGLDSEVPREFRAENARRALETKLAAEAEGSPGVSGPVAGSPAAKQGTEEK